jgi:hypothetical protein
VLEDNVPLSPFLELCHVFTRGGATKWARMVQWENILRASSLHGRTTATLLLRLSWAPETTANLLRATKIIGRGQECRSLHISHARLRRLAKLVQVDQKAPVKPHGERATVDFKVPQNREASDRHADVRLKVQQASVVLYITVNACLHQS